MDQSTLHESQNRPSTKPGWPAKLQFPEEGRRGTCHCYHRFSALADGRTAARGRSCAPTERCVICPNRNSSHRSNAGNKPVEDFKATLPVLTANMTPLIPGSFFRVLLPGWRVAVPVLEADHRAPAARHEVVQQHGEARQPAPHPAELHRPQLRELTSS